jgi:hypothetical protein
MRPKASVSSDKLKAVYDEFSSKENLQDCHSLYDGVPAIKGRTRPKTRSEVTTRIIKKHHVDELATKRPLDMVDTRLISNESDRTDEVCVQSLQQNAADQLFSKEYIHEFSSDINIAQKEPTMWPSLASKSDTILQNSPLAAQVDHFINFIA